MGYDVKIERNLLHALFDLKGSFKDLNSYMKEHIASLPEEPNSYVAHGTWKILYLGINHWILLAPCLLYTSPSPRDRTRSRMPSSA